MIFSGVDVFYCDFSLLSVKHFFSAFLYEWIKNINVWRCQFSLLVCPSSYYFIYVFFLISSIVLFNMCRRSASVASSYLLTYSLHVELILLGYDGEDMIVLGTSGGGDDLVCNVVIFLGRLDFSVPTVAPMSNLWGFIYRFGPLLAFLLLWRPFCGSFLLFLDFWRVSRHFEVQSVMVSCSFWTSDVSLTASKSNPYNFTLPRCSHFSNPQKNKSNASIVVLPALLCSLHI